jgi:hypothetical protein
MTSPAQRWLIAAWIGAGVTPLFAVLAIAAGEIAAALLGYPDDPAPPSGVRVAAAAAALVVAAVPSVVAVVGGVRAFMLGRRTGWIPALLGVIAFGVQAVLLGIGLIAGPLGA